MRTPLRFIQIGTGGMGGNWCNLVWPRLINMGKAVPVAAVDIVPDHFSPAIDYLKLPPEKCYTDTRKAFRETAADFAVVVVQPAHHEEVINVALEHDCHILSEKPIADSMDSTARVYRNLKSAGKRMAVTMSHRFDQDKQSLEALVQSGRLWRHQLRRRTKHVELSNLSGLGRVPLQDSRYTADRRHGASFRLYSVHYKLRCKECLRHVLEPSLERF